MLVCNKGELTEIERERERERERVVKPMHGGLRVYGEWESDHCAAE